MEEDSLAARLSAMGAPAQFPHATLAERCKAPLNRLAARREAGSTIERKSSNDRREDHVETRKASCL